MNVRLLQFLCTLLLLVSTAASAQYIRVDDTYTAQDLVQNVLINNQCASVSNVSVSGAVFDSGQSYGYFNGNGSTFPFTDGIILSTGKAVMAAGPNTTLLDDGNGIGWGGDQDLEQALDISNSVNATLLEFDFVPLASSISFDYMLASEEYHDNAPCNYSDGFAFLLKPAGSTDPYQNLAVIPGTTTPVKVTSVHPQIGGNSGCPAQNEQYFGGFNGTEYPTNFNGQTTVLTAQANVMPDVQYHIKLVIADESNYRYDSAIFLGGGSFTASVDLGPDRLLATNNPLCSGESHVLDATIPGATEYKWYKNNNEIAGETNATYTVTSAGDYSVTVQFTQVCTAQGKITIEYASPPIFGTTYTLLQCDDNADGLTAYNLEAAGNLAENNNPDLEAVAYFLNQADAQNNINAITTVSPFYNTVANQPIYIRVKNQYGCEGIATALLSASNNTVANPAPLEECDTDGKDDGFYTFNLSEAEPQIIANLPAGVQVSYYTGYTDALTDTNAISDIYSFTNTTANSQVIYANISQGSDCYGVAQVQLLVHSFGNALQDEDVILCKGETVTLDAGSGYTSYNWDTVPAVATQAVTVSQAGTYTVTVTNRYNCIGAKTFTVTQSGPAESIAVDINDFNGGNNTATITATGVGSYVYSIDGTNFQPSPLFTNLITGEYIAYVKDDNGCGGVLSKKFAVLDYLNYFTPNGDATHETWRIPYLNQRPGVNVTIFDRYGKLIYSFRGNSPGWDGTLNGYKLPATDYWFVIALENGRTVKGHFSLIR